MYLKRKVRTIEITEVAERLRLSLRLIRYGKQSIEMLNENEMKRTVFFYAKFLKKKTK